MDQHGRSPGAAISLSRVREPGPLLASGRDSEIFEYGPGLVLRRSRHRRSLAYEADVMAYLRAQGYPVPAVHELSDDGCDLVLERIDGPSMGDALAQAPWRLRRQARVLAALHRRLHAFPAPDFLRPAPLGQGDRIVHLDLHPLNVIVGPKGPVVIDWANAARGDPATDVGLAWVLVVGGDIPGNRLLAKLLGLGRSLFASSFLDGFDRAEIVGRLDTVVEYKARDPNMSPHEIEAMRRLVAQVRQADGSA